jgi:hypothetical protein
MAAKLACTQDYEIEYAFENFKYDIFFPPVGLRKGMKVDYIEMRKLNIASFLGIRAN